ncbi:MAG: hypothetical protein ACK42C_09390, partial [Aquificaceae bacterium]
EGQEVPLEFPDSVPMTTEKHIKAVVETAGHYGLNPWLLLHKLLPSALDWREEEYVVLSEKPHRFLDRKSLEILAWVGKRKKVKEENLRKRFGDGPVRHLMELGFLIKMREWKAPELSEKIYRLSLPIEEAIQRLRALKRGEDAIRLLYFLLERGYASEEDLKDKGFKTGQIRALIKKGLVVEVDEELPQISFKPTKLRQEIKTILKPLGRKTLLMGSWQGISERLFEELQAIAEKKSSVLLFCDHLEMLKCLYEELYPVLGDRLVLLSSLQKEREFVRNWFRVGEEDGLVVLGSRLALLSPIRNLKLLVLLGDRASKLQDGTNLRHLLFELARYYGAGFCIASPLPPVSLCLREGWEREVFTPTAEVLVVKRKPEEVLATDTVRLLKDCAGEESLILVNKVGYAYAYCRVCGYVLECPQCGSFLTLSKDGNVVFCNS